jgi:hypothetical protein
MDSLQSLADLAQRGESLSNRLLPASVVEMLRVVR